MLKSWNQVFLVGASRNQLNVRYLVLIIDMKIFYEHHANYFWKVGMKCFWAKQAEMSLMSVNFFPIDEIKIICEHVANHV